MNKEDEVKNAEICGRKEGKEWTMVMKGNGKGEKEMGRGNEE